MNYLKNRYPFKLLTNFFRATAIRLNPNDPIQSPVEIKRNKSDSAIVEATKESLSKEKLNLTKKLSQSLSECNNLEKKSSCKSVESNTSLPFSKTSSEQSFRCSLDRKRTLFDLKSIDSLEPRKTNMTLNRELKLKLKKLQNSLDNSSKNSSREVLSEEERPRLKRSYPWQNFNLNNVPKVPSNENIAKNPINLLSRKNSLKLSSSDHSMISVSSSSLSTKTSNQSLQSFKSSSCNSSPRKQISQECIQESKDPIPPSNQSLQSFKSTSCKSLPRKQISQECIQESKDQIPLYKSILKKSMYREKPNKEVTFNNISTIYGPGSSYLQMAKQTQTSANHVEASASSQRPKQPSSMMNNINLAIKNTNKKGNESIKVAKKKNNPNLRLDVDSCVGRYEPLKEQHSFLYLYKEKRPKTHM